jgi:hypothetical protein
MAETRQRADDQSRLDWGRGQIQRQKKTSLTIADFCRQRGVSVPTFFSWKRRVPEGPGTSFGRSPGDHPSSHPTTPAAATPVHFVPVSIVDPDAGTHLEIDHSASERAEKTMAIGRGNGLSFGSEGGGATAAILFRRTETCPRRGVEPWTYLRAVRDRVSMHPARRIEERLPDRGEALRREGAIPSEATDGSADPYHRRGETESQRRGIGDRS